MNAKLPAIRACVFDAYGTLFDVNSAARQEQDALGQRWQPLAELWRNKQLQYTWLRSLAAHHTDFEQITADALDYALEALSIENKALRERLLLLYWKLGTYPEVPATLQRLKSAGLRLAILSNGTPQMLASAAGSAGIIATLETILSVEEVKIFKPHHTVYELACNRLSLTPEQICFVSSNGWDAYSAKAFGMRVLWCNRMSLPPERIPATPDAEIAALDEITEFVL